MPIRFRCVYCGQLLAIATRKAGMEVDCPKCSHPNMVPKKDEPEESPKAGKRLKAFESNKFDQWIGREPSKNPTPEFVSPSEKEESDSVVDSVTEQSEPMTGSESASAVEEPWRKEPESLPTGKSADIRAEPYSPGLARSLASLAVILLLVAFTLGLIVGRYVVPVDPRQAKDNPLGSILTPSDEPKPDSKPAKEEAMTPSPANVADSTTFRGVVEKAERDDAPRAPDVGALVVAFPAQVNIPPESRVAARQLLQMETGASFKELDQWGGRWARTGTDGAFTLPLVVGRPYWILIVSGSVDRPEQKALFQVDEQALANFFDDYTSLLGKRDFLLTNKTPKAGQEIAPLHHCFLAGQKNNR